MPLRDGERQVAPTLEGIRADHRYRYEWVAKHLSGTETVVDAGCGVGYGSSVLARVSGDVFAFDRDRETIEYAKKHYAAGVTSLHFSQASADSVGEFHRDVAVAFEIIEHLADPRPLLSEALRGCKTLFASVPNEKVFPFKNYAFHHRHYTREEFEALLDECGWAVVEWWGQMGPESEVERDMEGRTLIVKAVRSEAIVRPAAPVKHPNASVTTTWTQNKLPVPHHVAIVGLGPSHREFFKMALHMGGTSAYCDEVWGINQIGDVLVCDRVFHMDDLAVQEARAARDPKSNIAAMVRWLKRHPGPVYTSVVREGYPGLVAFPLEAVLNRTKEGNGGVPYLNSTAAYAVAYAIHIGVKRISLYGVDYTQPNAYAGEKGRSCVEFWLGIAAARGIEIMVPNSSPLLDMCAPHDERLYGYDGVDVTFSKRADGGLAVKMAPKEIPTAEEIEHRYDHTRHPNRIVEAQQMKAAAE